MTIHADRQASPRGASPSASDNLPMNAEEATWMKTKKTLKYFREVYKTPALSNLILPWYCLEKSLGFPETVSVPTIRAARTFPNVSQTPKGFPVTKRPKVILSFTRTVIATGRTTGWRPKPWVLTLSPGGMRSRLRTFTSAGRPEPADLSSS